MTTATGGAAKDQVARLLRLVPFLHSRGQVSLEEAARVLGVAPEQLEKDLRVLFLCGLPGGYPVIRHDSTPRRLCTGIHWVERTWMVVNRGFGFSGMPVRLFCPAEVLDLRLTRMT